MHSVLPRTIDPVRLAVTGAVLEGELDLVDFPRLAAAAKATGESSGAAAGEPVRVSLRAELAGGGNVRLTGAVQARLDLVCQRCLEDLRLDVGQPFSVLVVTAEQDDAELPAGVEGVVADGGRLNLVHLLEEELLLGLPGAPMHAAQACAAPEGDDVGAASMAGGEPAPSAPSGSMPAGDEAQERRRPFSGLADLMKQR